MALAKMKVDVTKASELLKKLNGDFVERLGRSMCVAAGTELRDEAIARAPVKDGVLRDAMHLVYKDRDSLLAQHPVYHVTWNSIKAPHGHLIEFGHWQPYVIYKDSNGEWRTSKTLLKSPRWTSAKPFLSPAWEAKKNVAMDLALKRGKDVFPLLLAKQKGG